MATSSFSIIQINDVYEIGALENGKVGGMARVATLEKEIRQSAPNTYLVLAGDFLSPSVIGTVKLNGERVQGEHMVDIMNQTGVDWVVFGNHEFDIKEKALLKRLDESEFGWIGGNVLHQSDNKMEPFLQNGKPVPTYTIWSVPNANGSTIKVGVIGVCLDFNKQSYVAYEDVYTSAIRDYQTIKDSVDFCIALTHLSLAEDQELARRIPELKLIMGGHEHERHNETVGTVPITKADANAKSAWVHQFQWDGKKVNIQSTLREIDASITPDPTIAASVKAWEEKAYSAFRAQGFDLSAPVVSLTEPLNGLEKDIRSKQTNLGFALGKSMFEACGDVSCAIINGGSVRIDDFLRGNVTEFDLVRALPYGGSVLKVDMQGSLLIQVLTTGEANQGSGGYLQRYGAEKKQGKWTLDMQPIDPEKVYRVAVSDFLMTGLESNFEYLTQDNAQVQAVIRPGTESILRDVRLVLAEYLKKQ